MDFIKDLCKYISSKNIFFAMLVRVKLSMQIVTTFGKS